MPGNPRNSGGKKGRSGRKSNDFKAQVEAIRDEHGLPLLEKMLNGEVTYTLTATCAHCGKPSSGPDEREVVKIVPTLDTQPRALEISMRYSVGLEKTIRIEGDHRGQ